MGNSKEISDALKVGDAIAANVSMTEAMAYDTSSGTERWFALKAEDYNPDTQSHLKFYCPCCFEKGMQVQLRKPSRGDGPNNGYFQNLPFDLFDPENGEPVLDPETKKQKIESRRYYFPPHYTTLPGQTHHDTCETAKNQKDLALVVRELGGTTLNSDQNIRYLNLNIPAGQKIVQPERPSLKDSNGANFNGKAGHHPARRIHQSARKRQPGDTGVSTVADIGRLLELTAADPQQREKLLFRRGNEVLRLSELFQDDLRRFCNLLATREKQQGSQNGHAAAFLLSLPKTVEWINEQNGSRSIKIKTTKTLVDGHREGTTLKVNFENPAAETMFKNVLADGERSFLVYSEHVSVADDHRAIKMIVHTPQQIASWSPQKSLDFDLEQDANPKPNEKPPEPAELTH